MRDRLLTLAGLLGLCGLAWAYLIHEAAAMGDVPATAGVPSMSGMPAMAGAWTLTELGYLSVMWSIMMVAMMLPSSAPTIFLVARLDRSRKEAGRADGSPSRRPSVTPAFVSGYLLAWSGYSIVAATAQWALHGGLLVSPAMVSLSPALSGGLLVAAGAYQLTPLKDRCVTHCRSPLSFLTASWREGIGGAVRMGLHHGTYCVGCCWALMGLLFVLGVMNLLWVTALAILVLVEKTLSNGRWVTWGAGAVLLGWGALTLLGAAGLI